MKRFIITILAVLTFAGIAWAATGELQRDSGNLGNVIQGAAWNGTKAANLTIASTIVNFTSDLVYSVYSPVDCYERWMPLSTSTKASYVQTPILAGQWQSAVINSATPFGNFSGCTGGKLKKQ